MTNLIVRSIIKWFQARSGGIVMVSFYPHFISCGEKSTLEDVAGEFRPRHVQLIDPLTISVHSSRFRCSFAQPTRRTRTGLGDGKPRGCCRPAGWTAKARTRLVGAGARFLSPAGLASVPRTTDESEPPSLIPCSITGETRRWIIYGWLSRHARAAPSRAGFDSRGARNSCLPAASPRRSAPSWN